jgi:hypothetical protein
MSNQPSEALQPDLYRNPDRRLATLQVYQREYGRRWLHRRFQRSNVDVMATGVYIRLDVRTSGLHPQSSIPLLSACLERIITNYLLHLPKLTISTMSANDQYDQAPAGDAGDNDYVSRTGQSEIPVQKDEAPIEDPYNTASADSDEQLGKISSTKEDSHANTL